MELRTYQALKAKGAATLEHKGDGAFQLSVAQYDTDSGQPAEPKRIGLSREALEHALKEHSQAIVDHQAEIVGIKQLLAEMDAL